MSHIAGIMFVLAFYWFPQKFTMFSRLITVVLSALLANPLLPQTVLCAPIDDWNVIVTEGSKYKFDGKYEIAIQSFAKAVSFAEKQKLPDKCLPISLCRVAEVELITNNVKEADSHFEQIISLIKAQKNAGTLDPQVNFWAAALADAYQSNYKLDTRELCLKHACYLKTLVYGAHHRECLDCLSKLADCYIDENKVDKAIPILTFKQALLDKQYGKNPDALGDTLNDLALKCEKEHKYQPAKELELGVIDLAKRSKPSSSLNSGLPAFYCFLSMNALAQGKLTEDKKYFDSAKQECHKIVKEKKKKIEPYLGSLVEVCLSDQTGKKNDLAIAEMKKLLTIHELIKTDPSTQYVVYTHLAALGGGGDWRGHTRLLQHAIDIVSRPDNPCHKDLPSLYMRMAMGIQEHDFNKGNELFAKALKMAKGPN